MVLCPLSTRWGQGIWHIATASATRRSIKAVRRRDHRLSGSRKKGSNAAHAKYAGDAGDDGGGKREGGGKGNGERRGKHGPSGGGTEEAGGCSAAAAGGDGNSAKAAEGTVVPPRRGASGVARRVLGLSTVRRS